MKFHERKILLRSNFCLDRDRNLIDLPEYAGMQKKKEMDKNYIYRKVFNIRPTNSNFSAINKIPSSPPPSLYRRTINGRALCN